MKTSNDAAVARQFRTLFHLGAARALSDGQLLERFSTARGEAAELAFAALIDRHGAMVVRVCRALLADPHDAQDACQATFLILVRKARGLWVRDSLGPWLHQVAVRTASAARSAAARRRRHERRRAEMAAGLLGPDGRAGPEREREGERVLHEEIARLPERFRVPIVLCDLEGLTCEEAARRMGRPVGTVKSWRSRGRDRLRARLTRLGLAPAAGLGVGLAADSARGAEAEAVRLAARLFTRGATAGGVSASVRVLVKGVLTAMILDKLRTATAAVLAVAVLGIGLGAAGAGGDDPARKDEVPRRPEPPAAQDSPEGWPLTLREAIRLALRNSPAVRPVAPPRGEATGDGVTIAPAAVGVDPQRFRAEIMAVVRSVEQQYWALVQQQARQKADAQAVELAERVVARELAEQKAGRGGIADVAEARQRLDQFQLDRVTATSDAITTERQHRRLLGLPPAEGRRIVPVTPPTEARLEPDWETCKAAMRVKQPDVVRAGLDVAAALQAGDSPAVTRGQAFLQQVVNQTTHSLARFFLEIEANYQQFRTASRLRAAASQRLEAQRAFYQEGRVTVDRYLDAIGRHAAAVAQEAQFKTSYNTSVVALEEAKGTLLESYGITVVDPPTIPTAAAVRGDAPMPAPPDLPATAPVPAPGSGGTAKGDGPTANPDGKTVSFRMTFGRGPKPFEIRGSFTVAPARP